MKYGLCVSFVALYSLTVSALPIIEIRTTDTDGGSTTRLQLLALPILREIALPDSAFYYMTSDYNQGCSPISQQTGETNLGTEATADDGGVKKIGENAGKNEIPSFTFYV